MNYKKVLIQMERITTKVDGEIMKERKDLIRLYTDGCSPELMQNTNRIGILDFPKLINKREIPFITGITPFGFEKSNPSLSEAIGVNFGSISLIDFIPNMQEYINYFKSFSVTVGTDYSLYFTKSLVPFLQRLYKVYLILNQVQKNHIDIVFPAIWGDERTYMPSLNKERLAFSCIPKGAVVSICTNGKLRNKKEIYHFKAGLEALIKDREPRCIIVYGSMPKVIFNDLLEKVNFISYRTSKELKAINPIRHKYKGYLATLDDGFDEKLIENVELSGFFGSPLVKTCNSFIPKGITLFSHRNQAPTDGEALAFFEYDRVFLKILKNPEKYIDEFKKFKGVFMPDFSLYTDAPLIVQLINCYRAHVIGAFLQNHGVNIIEFCRWGTKETFSVIYNNEKLAFMGFQKNSLIAVSNHGCYLHKEDKQLFDEGLDAMIKYLEPKDVLVYGSNKSPVCKKYENVVNFHFYKNWATRMRGGEL